MGGSYLNTPAVPSMHIIIHPKELTEIIKSILRPVIDNPQRPHLDRPSIKREYERRRSDIARYQYLPQTGTYNVI
jgi:hypothetical protein